MKNILSPVLAGLSLLIIGGIITNSIIDGEQLVIKFLATVVVAALGLYIISDLRLRQSENSAILSNQSSAIDTIQQTESGLPNMPLFRSKVADEPATSTPPSNSTAAFMANINKAKDHPDAVAPDDRSYSAMNRVSQKRRRRSSEGEQPIMAPVVKLKKASPKEEPAPTAPPTKTNEADLPDLDETTLNAAPLETLRVENPVEGLLPSETNTADTIPPGIHSPLIDVGEDPTSILSIPTDAEVQEADFDESVTWIIVDDPTEEGDHEQQLVENANVDEVEADETPNGDDNAESNDEKVEAASPERRRFAPEDINIGDLRPVDIEEVQETDGTSTAILTAPSSLSGPETNDDAELAETTTSPSPLSAINNAIADGEQTIISSLIEQGVLSPEGPITDSDVTTMIYVAFTSSELRKILQDGGTMDTHNGEISLEGLGIYTSDELKKDDQFLVVGPDETVSRLETKTRI